MNGMPKLLPSIQVVGIDLGFGDERNAYVVLFDIIREVI